MMAVFSWGVPWPVYRKRNWRSTTHSATVASTIAMSMPKQMRGPPWNDRNVGGVADAPPRAQRSGLNRSGSG